MILNLNEDHKQHISILLAQPEQVIQDFCKLATEFLKKGHNHKLNALAAQDILCTTAASLNQSLLVYLILLTEKLGVEPENIRLAVEALVELLVEGHRHKLSNFDLRDSLLAAGLSEEQQEVISAFYNKTREEIEEALNSLAPSLTHYYDLQWRFDVEVASRALHHQITPVITMKLTLEDRMTEGSSNDVKSLSSVVIQTDPNSLKHITNKLDTALQEANSHHCRRTQRIVNQLR